MWTTVAERAHAMSHGHAETFADVGVLGVNDGAVSESLDRVDCLPADHEASDNHPKAACSISRPGEGSSRADGSSVPSAV